MVVKQAKLALLLGPMGPFISERGWRDGRGFRDSVHRQFWISYSDVVAQESGVTGVVQVNGRVRDKLEAER